MEELERVYTASGQIQAHVIKGRLESAGIPVLLRYDSGSTVFALTVDGLGEVHLLVPRDQAARARKRGVYTWSPVDASASDPFGIFQRFVPVEAQGDAVVYPKPLDLNGGLARSGIEIRGMSAGERSRGSESGLDFYGIRDYTPGDDLRRIHWPTTARHGKLTVSTRRTVFPQRSATRMSKCALAPDTAGTGGYATTSPVSSSSS